MSEKPKYEMATYMRSFFLKQPLEKEAIEQINVYMTVRFLAMTNTAPQIANIINRYTFLFRNYKEHLYDVLYKLVPRQSRQPYVAYAKKEQLKYSEEIYNVLRYLYGDWYNCVELDELVEYSLKIQYLKEELYNFLLKSGIDIKVLQDNFPQLFNNIKKDVSIKKVHKELLQELKKKEITVSDIL